MRSRMGTEFDEQLVASEYQSQQARLGRMLVYNERAKQQAQ